MAIYYSTFRILGRSAGRSAVAAAAYRAGERLCDERSGMVHDYTDKPGVAHAAVMLPAGAPDEYADRGTLWNAVEAGERRKDSQLARQLEFALPRELSVQANVELARSLVQEAFVDRGMVADLAVHVGRARDGDDQPHAHVLLTLREVGPAGFGAKRTEWNDRGLVNGWRSLLAVRTNEALERSGSTERVDHRSYAERGLELEAQVKVGPGATGRRESDREAAGREAENRAIGRRNGERLAADPGVALHMLTEHASTFTRRDAARLVSMHTADAEQFAAVMARLDAHPDVVRVGTDRFGRERFTTRQLRAVERRLAEDAASLERTRGHATDAGMVARAAAAAGLGGEQAAALAHVTRAGDLSLVVGFAGTGKSTMLGAAREVWEAEGYRVRGAALSGIAAEGLEGGSGIGSRTIASLEHAWARERDRLERGDVLVVDEAGMVGSRQMGRVLAAAEAAGAKVVLVGDPAQLQAIEAGAAFRLLAAGHGAATLTEVRRQHEAWQRVATRDLATGETGRALRAYAGAGMIHEAADRAEARAALVGRWDASRREDPSRTQAILVATRAEVTELNALARERVRASGDLAGGDVSVRTERGPRPMAAGERVMFLRNDRGLGVKNGTLGIVRAIGGNGAELSVQLDGASGAGTGRAVSFDVRDYGHVEHGYAATVHKSQGITVDRAHVLATPGLGREGAYVALSRQRERVDVTYAREDFADGAALARGLGRERPKDTTLDYASRPAAVVVEAPAVPPPVPEPAAGRESGPAAPMPAAPPRSRVLALARGVGAALAAERRGREAEEAARRERERAAEASKGGERGREGAGLPPAGKALADRLAAEMLRIVEGIRGQNRERDRRRAEERERSWDDGGLSL